MSRQTMTQEEKEMLALFRGWLRNPTNPYVLKRLVENMVDYELKFRFKYRHTDSEGSPREQL